MTSAATLFFLGVELKYFFNTVIDFFPTVTNAGLSFGYLPRQFIPLVVIKKRKNIGSAQIKKNVFDYHFYKTAARRITLDQFLPLSVMSF